MNTAGWMLTENGRQPWIVQGLDARRKDGVSPSVSSTEIWISLIVFVVLYVAARRRRRLLMFRYARKALGEGDEDDGTMPPDDDANRRSDDERVPALTY